MATPEIYVQIPAYRDGELASTLLDLYAQANRPTRLRTRVIWQHARGEQLPERVRRLPGVEIEDLPAEQSHGCGWARRRARAGWAGEPYTLLLDSHHRFVDGWDDLVLEMYAALEAAGHAKPLLTAYLPAYDPASEPWGRREVPYRMYPLGREEGVLTKLTSRPIPWWEQLNIPVPADFLSYHFLFAAGTFNVQVPIDPEPYFFGDEIVLSLRAYQLGYDFFHPHRVVGWHAYSRTARVPHWDDHPDWGERHRAALRWMRELAAGRHPLPNEVRTISDYEQHIMTRIVRSAAA